MGHSTFQVGDLSAVIGDNAAHEKHRAGYNGLWSLRHRASQRSLFVPGIAGLNYEHIFNGDPVGPREVFFEPRNAPMTFRKISDSEAELHQPATPTFHLESWTRFKLVAPHYIDMTFRCVPRQHAFPRGWIGRPSIGISPRSATTFPSTTAISKSIPGRSCSTEPREFASRIRPPAAG
jgi:hypothetical protein